MKIPTLKQVEERLGEEAIYWAGNCYGVAVKVNEAFEDLDGVALYGHYTGPIAPGSIFYGRGLVQHGWIELPDGTVLDPTRWAFTSPNMPFLYHGPADHYDEGGNRHRIEMMKAFGFPAYQEDRPEPDFDPPLTEPMAEFVGDQKRWSTNQIFWLASQAYELVGAETYNYILKNCKHGNAMIPIDNRNRLDRENG